MAARGARDRNKDRLSFAADVAAAGLRPLWEAAPAPPPPAPRMWRWAEMRLCLMQASEIAAKEQAERRVLTLGGAPGESFLSQTLSAGLQLIMPGERARPHRHAASALRFVLESDGAFTTVNGERIAMAPGDLVATPAWSWHGHGNAGASPAIWLDGLDAPIARALGAIPVRATPATGIGGLVTRAEMWSRMVALMNRTRPDAAHGWRLRYSDPAPTLSAFMQCFPEGFESLRTGCEATSVICVLEGRLEAHIGSSVFECVPHDLVFVAAGLPTRWRALARCLVFSFSDLALRERLGFAERS